MIGLCEQMMLMLIKDRLNNDTGECDEVMLHAWSLLWNVTGRSTAFADRVSASFSLQSFHIYIFNFIRRNKNDSSKTIIKRKNKENNINQNKQSIKNTDRKNTISMISFYRATQLC